MELKLKKAGKLKRAVYAVRCLFRRLWFRIRPKSQRYSHGFDKGDIIRFKGVDGANDGDYEITDLH